nr:flagellar protein FlaG [Lysinibacillus timonensis]
MVNRISDSGFNVSDSTALKSERIKSRDIDISLTSSNAQVNMTITENSSQENSTEETLPAEKVQQMTESLNTLLETTNTKLRYEFHEKLEKYYVTLVDSKTDQVVQEIPNKKLMDMYAAMLDFVGLFIDKKI